MLRQPWGSFIQTGRSTALRVDHRALQILTYARREVRQSRPFGALRPGPHGGRESVSHLARQCAGQRRPTSHQTNSDICTQPDMVSKATQMNFGPTPGSSNRKVGATSRAALAPDRGDLVQHDNTSFHQRDSTGMLPWAGSQRAWLHYCERMEGGRMPACITHALRRSRGGRHR